MPAAGIAAGVFISAQQLFPKLRLRLLEPAAFHARNRHFPSPAPLAWHEGAQAIIGNVTPGNKLGGYESS